MRLSRLLPLVALALPMMLRAQDSEIDKCASTLASRIAQPEGATVAVVDFSDLQGRITELGRYYAEELSVALVNTGKGVKVIDRAHLQTLLKELKFQQSGMIDEHTASELGRLAGVTILITGSVTELTDQVRLTVKAMTTKTAAIQAAASVRLPKDATTMALLRRDVGVSGNPSAAPTPSAPTAPNARVFQNDFLIATVESVSVRKERNALVCHLALSIENKSGKQEFIACKARSYSGNPGDPEATLMDSLGSPWRLQKVTGAQILQTHYPSKQDRYTRLASGAKQTLICAFQARAGEGKSPLPESVSFAIEMARFTEVGQNNVEQFSLGISNISVPRLAPVD